MFDVARQAFLCVFGPGGLLWRKLVAVLAPDPVPDVQVGTRDTPLIISSYKNCTASVYAIRADLSSKLVH